MVILELSEDDAEFLRNFLEKHKHRCRRNIIDLKKIRSDRILGPYGITTEETLQKIQEFINIFNRILEQL